MAAIINEHHPSMTTSSLGENAKLELSQKIEGQLGGRITGICIFPQDDGLLTINEDKSLRVLLKRESGQYWPSIVQDLPNIPTKLYYENSNNLIFVGFVNGLVYEYSIENDLNSISFKRQWPSHTSTVTGLGYSRKHSYIVSCSKDKTIVWHCTTTTKKIGSYCASSPCTAMEFDEDTSFIFIGDYSNNVYVLRLIEGTFQPQLISKLNAHTGSITDLAWDSANQLLYSASTDSLIIVWDIGGRRGNCYELNGHNSKLTKLGLGKQNPRRLFSADESGRLMCWDMETKRITAPAWRDSDKCEICDQPFFWNLKDMWDRKIVGVRRHHCRTCGQSVCSNCCNNFTIFPAMGFEKPIRICKTCHGKMQNFPDQFNLTPLAITNDLRQGIIEMAFDEQKQRLVTVGYDRVIMIWDVRNLL